MEIEGKKTAAAAKYLSTELPSATSKLDCRGSVIFEFLSYVRSLSHQTTT